MSGIGDITCRDHVSTRCRGALLATAVVLLVSVGIPAANAQIYRWVDADGVIHLSSEKPPPGVKAERLDIKTGSQRSTAGAGGSGSPGKPAAAGATRQVSAAQASERNAVLGGLRNRECVIALEALERKTSGSEPASAAEIKRLKQTAELNCSQDPTRRREQEQQAMQLRMANSPSCTQARDRLADMMAPGASTPRDELRAQQAYVEEHCTPPVR